MINIYSSIQRLKFGKFVDETATILPNIVYSWFIEEQWRLQDILIIKNFSHLKLKLCLKEDGLAEAHSTAYRI